MKNKTKMNASTWVTNELATDPESNKTIQNQSSLPVTHQEHIHSDPGRDTQAQTSIRTHERKPTFHIFKGIPEGHSSYAFIFASVLAILNIFPYVGAILGNGLLVILHFI